MQCCLLIFLKPLLFLALFSREVYDVEIDSLPASNTRDDLSLCCDTCTRKGVTNQQAVVYCKTCTARFCAKHREVRMSKILLLYMLLQSFAYLAAETVNLC